VAIFLPALDFIPSISKRKLFPLPQGPFLPPPTKARGTALVIEARKKRKGEMVETDSS